MDQPDSGGNRYAFIFNSDKRPSLALPRLNLPRPVGIGLLIIFLIMILFVILLLSGSKSSPLTQVAARQKEIARVAVLASSSAQSQNVKDLAATVDSVFSGEQNQSAKALGISVSSSKLNLYYNKNTDDQLQAATQNNSFDQAYLQILKAELQAYSQAVLSTSKQLPAKSSDQILLATDLSDAQNLLGDPAFKSL